MKKTTLRPFLYASAAILPLLVACSDAPDAADEASATSADELSVARLADDASRIAVSLKPAGKSDLAAADAVSVTVTLTNTSDRTARVLRWLTPEQGIHEPLFDVTLDGVAVEYTGRHSKRLAPRAKDYVKLAPGESLVRTVDLAEAYDLEASGAYAIRYHGLGTSEGGTASLSRSGGASNELTLNVEGRAAKVDDAPVERDPLALGTTGFSGSCTTAEKTQINTAMASAATYAANAVTYLNATGSNAKKRYTTWFGAYSSTNWSTAKSHFTKIKSAIDSKNYVVDCSCNEDGTFAYVYPSNPYKVYVCGAFWDTSNTGTDSRAGTIVHESSHFTILAGTDDHAYGQSAAKRLATSTPTRALDNADNHEYFAENTPSLN